MIGMNDAISKAGQAKKNVAEKFICKTIQELTPLGEKDFKTRRIIDALNFTVMLIMESPISFWEEERKTDKDKSAGRIVNWN